ncbi:hypothetical protein IB270_33660 [Ensifer sp. ENS05]|uniref:hypothetical protein n=1 Tax=Ensifer sp. ENS05 TaxID=2769277 RepID=UPI0017820BFD|nr:hypothetical protein [Ensifer sp. ENS05]MBD9597773.1 hypothetical protein [Ensifer sp. ENS05]
MELIPSLNVPLDIELTGFSNGDEVIHMIAMLGRGKDFRRFVVRDVEAELYAQTPNAQLLSITCKTEPRLKTTERSNLARVARW